MTALRVSSHKRWGYWNHVCIFRQQETSVGYIKKWREEARRGEWGNPQKYCFPEEVAFELALEWQVAAQFVKPTFTQMLYYPKLIRFSALEFLNQINTGQADGTPGLDLNVAEAWELGYTGKGVTIGIMDDGEYFKAFTSFGSKYVFACLWNRKDSLFWRC